MNKRILTTVLAVALALTMTSNAVFALGGEMLYKYKFIRGASSTTMDLKEENPLTREQLAVLITQINGKEAEVVAKKDDANFVNQIKVFKDHETIAGWAKHYVAYCYREGLLVGSDGKFKPKGQVTGRQLALVLLRAMGYDVQWKAVDAKLQELGIPLANEPLKRGAAFDYMWSTIIKPICKDGGILAVKLGKLTEEEARLLQTQEP
ncbi:MAG: S-layer homology domain-containing protein, partial [Bacillota bacterium]|nr:S-layer homology domain-containing protein [Bacillota bacterium]